MLLGDTETSVRSFCVIEVERATTPLDALTKPPTGNHDITLDTRFYNQYGAYFHNQGLEDVSKCQEILQNSPSITYLRHSSATICLDRPSGPQTTFKVFGSPYSPANGMWAFGYEPYEAEQVWSKVHFPSTL